MNKLLNNEYNLDELEHYINKCLPYFLINYRINKKSEYTIDDKELQELISKNNINSNFEKIITYSQIEQMKKKAFEILINSDYNRLI